MSKSMSELRYAVFKRQDRDGWWYRYWITDTRRSSSLSVDTLVRRLGLKAEYPVVKGKRQAEQIVTLAYDKGVIRTEMGSKELLGPYLTAYWDFDGTRIKRLNKRRPGAVSENYASIMQGYIKNHILPKIRKGMAISDVTPRFVRDISDKLIDSDTMANATVDKIMIAFTKPLREAWENDLIHENPTKLMEKMDTAPEKMRGILTRGEFQMVLALMREAATEHVYLAVLLAAATGMRLGEIRALRTPDISIVNEQDALVTVSKSWSVKGGEKSTKGKKVRFVPCPTWLAEKLLALGRLNSYGTDAVFWSVTETRGNSPVSSNYIREKFYGFLYDVLDAENGFKPKKKVEDKEKSKPDKKVYKWEYDTVEVDGVEVRRAELVRRERNISFHSFRHFFNTEAQALGADGDKLRLTVGHESKEMTDIYTHAEKRLDMVKSIADISHLIVGEAEVVEEKEIEG